MSERLSDEDLFRLGKDMPNILADYETHFAMWLQLIDELHERRANEARIKREAYEECARICDALSRDANAFNAAVAIRRTASVLGT